MTLRIVRYNERYYYKHTDYDDDDDDGVQAGHAIISKIPHRSKQYETWIDQKRATYAAKQLLLDRDVFSIRYPGPGNLTRLEYDRLPTAIPRTNGFWETHVYSINLDREVLTVGFGAHFTLPLSDILHRCCLHSLLLPSSMSPLTTRIVCQDAFPDEELGSTAVELPDRDDMIGCRSLIVEAKREIRHAGQYWLMRLLAEVSAEYATTLVRFGREWAPESLPFRELTFAILWIASGKAKSLSFPAGMCNPWTCWLAGRAECELSLSSYDMPTTGWFDKKWAGNDAPLLEFGSLFHRPGDSPGVSPAETMYWLDDVLVSLALVVDGAAVTRAVTWGIEQGRRNFQVVVLSLFKVILAEMSSPTRRASRSRPFVRVSAPLVLSEGVSEEDCLSTHQRDRSEREKEGRSATYFKLVKQRRRSETVHYPGFAALVNFFDVAASRRSAVKSTGALPPEMYCHILDHTDYNTWRACSTVSPAFRAYCLFKYRVDEEWRMVPGFLSPDSGSDCSIKPFKFMTFHAEHIPTGRVKDLVERDFGDRCCACLEMEEWNRMPIIGEEPRALMARVMLEFERCYMEAYEWMDGSEVSFDSFDSFERDTSMDDLE